MGVEKAEVVRDGDDVPHGDTGAFAGQRWGTRAIDIDFHPDPGNTRDASRQRWRPCRPSRRALPGSGLALVKPTLSSAATQLLYMPETRRQFGGTAAIDSPGVSGRALKTLHA